MILNTVAVWGATGSIGIEIVKAFLCRSWWVVAFGRSLSHKRFKAKVASDVDTLVERLCYMRMPDVSHDAIDSAIESCSSPWQSPQVYLNAAGTCFYGPFSSASTRDFYDIIKGNLEISFHIMKHVCDVIHRAPNKPLFYVEIGSRAGANVDHPMFSLYAMAKQGQAGLLRALAAEMQGTQCSFLLLSPRGVRTNLYERALGDRHALRQVFESSPDLLPAAHVAEAVVRDVEKWHMNGRKQPPYNFEQKEI